MPGPMVGNRGPAKWGETLTSHCPPDELICLQQTDPPSRRPFPPASSGLFNCKHAAILLPSREISTRLLSHPKDFTNSTQRAFERLPLLVRNADEFGYVRSIGSSH